jgi:cysteine-rich repeat protein
MFNRRTTITLTLLLAMVAIVGFFAPEVYAQGPVDQGAFESFAETAGFTTNAELEVIVARLIRTVLSFLGIVAVVIMLYGGFVWMTAGGNPDRVDTAKKIIINGTIGLVLVFSSFAITQFILGQLTEATGVQTGGGSGGPPGGGYPGPGGGTGGAQPFVLESLNDECSAAVRNLQLQYVFSNRVDADTVENDDGIVVRAQGGADVPGTFNVSGNSVTFTPDADCGGGSGEKCFDANTDYETVLDAAILEDTSGNSVICDAQNPCSFTFTTGSAIDTSGPNIAMNSPQDGASVIVNTIEQLQALAEDDVGVSSVDFDIDGEAFTSGLNSSTEGNLSPDNFFNYDWDTANYVTNSSINISAEGRDCAGNTDSSSTIRVTMRAASCDNGIQDNWETGVDCGGDPQDSKYCGACAGQSCSSNADCSSGVCQNGQCVSPTRITGYSPGDAAPDSLVTIEGTGFGTQPGTVTFIGDGTNSVSVSPYQCNGQTQWTDEQVVIQVPANAASGPISIETDSGESDRTDDDSGPRMSDFIVSQNQRPGLCMLQPSQAEPDTQITVHGVGLGQNQGNSTFYFGNTETQNIAGWSDTQFNAGVPLVNARTYETQVFVGDNTCSGSGNACVDDSDCQQGEVCEQGRFGSNNLEFDVLSRQTNQPPVIGSVDTGWRACDAASTNQGARCATDTDCTGGGSCVDVPTWGPPGQYVTITGSDFGSSTGTVQFINNDSNSANQGVTALGATDFPQACGNSGFWTDDSIVVKVPEEYQNQNQIEFTDHQVVISRAQDAVESDPTDFQIIDDAPGPSLCKLEPSLGPAGTAVDLIGENFEANQGSGTVTFFDGIDAGIIQSWSTDTIEGAEVPQNAQTGPVQVTTDAQYQSNTLPFEVANCNDSGVSCGAGTSCCGDGSCRVNCAVVAPKEAHYTYRFSTGDIPEVPRVKIACNANTVSPGPSSQWSDQEDICVNAQVNVEFTTEMDTASLSGGITVEECTGSAQDPCSTTQDASGNASTQGSRILKWTPNGGQFNQNTTYRVTLDSNTIISDEGASLPSDYSWQFTTRDNTDLCEVGSVIVTPQSVTATDQGERVDDFAATPLAANDRCVPLDPAQYPWQWTLDNNGQQQAQITAGATTPSPTVTANRETPSGSPVEVVGTAIAQNNPSDFGELNINFTDPEVLSVRPQCSTACVNAKIEARFNTSMNTNDLNLQNIELYECANGLCEQSGLQPVPFVNAVPSIRTGPSNIQNSVFSIDPGDTLNSNTFYRVVLSGGIRSSSGVPLSVAGANYFQDYSWIFKTKDSDEACAINRVEVQPSNKQMSYVGERAEFTAVALGAPDECSERGQVLTAQGNWQGWGVTEDDDDEPSAETVSILPAADQGRTDDLPVWCSDSCTLAGTPYQAPQGQCGDDNLDIGEDCDDGNLNNGDGCSAQCLNEGSDACSLTCSGSGASCSEDADCPQGQSCELSGSDCCGNGQVEGSEECDDGNITRGDGCSNICTNEGSDAVGGLAECGNGVVDQAPARGGEDCDDGNREAGDGCSNICLNEGTPPESEVYAVCGDGVVDPGEECDDGNTDDGDLCTSNCTNAGTPQCVQECIDTAGNSTGRNCTSDADCSGNATCQTINGPECCGNGSVDHDPLVGGEDCDGGEGCSDSCTLLGSSIEYTNPSICGNGNDETGEDPICENQAGTPTDGPYTAIEVQPGVAQELDDNNAARADLTTEADGEEGVSNIAVECSCETDAQCGSSGSLGCGAGSCCFERPQINTAQPVGTNACRNPGVWVQFTEEIDLSSIDRSEDDNQNGQIEQLEYDPQLFIAKIDANNRPVTDQNDCQNDLYQFAQDTQSEGNIFVRAWRWVVDTVTGWFGRSATAQSQEGCLVPVEYSQEQVTQNNQTFWKVRLLLPDALEPNEDYGVFVRGDDNINDAQSNGLLAASGVGFNIGAPQNLALATSFQTGGDICTLDRVGIEDQTDVPFRLSSIDEEHKLRATAYTLKNGSVPEEIQPIPNVYDWDWGWSTGTEGQPTGSSCTTNTDCSGNAVCENGSCVEYASDFDEVNVVDLEDAQPADPKHRNAVGAGNNGEENVYATARVTTDALNQPTTGPACSDNGEPCQQDADCNQGATCESGKGVVASEKMSANLCESPWPTNEELWTDDDHNFGFQYCRDAGPDGPDGDLPGLEVVEVTGQSQTGSPTTGVNILKEYLFIPTDAQDALGIRVIANPSFLPPDVWFEQQGFEGSPESIEVDGYEAIRVGNTIYATAANAVSQVYSNIYVISTNEDADDTSQAIFDQLTDTFTLNTNINNVGLCKVNGNIINDIGTDDQGNDVQLTGQLFSCEWDGDCTGATYQNGDPLPANANCDALKSKLTRDMERLTDLRRIELSVDNYGTGNRHCSDTRNQACFSDDQCPGNETCIPDVPDLQEGTFIRSMSTSLWPSWSAQLGNELGEGLPQDPINEFFCDDAAFDAETCFSQAESAFFCEEGSHAYAFRSVAGRSYYLYGQMEYDGAPWATDVDVSGNDNASYVVEGDLGGLGTRSGIAELCGGSQSKLGLSNTCGDGIQGPNEDCEIGDVKTQTSCTTSGGQQGVYRQVCIDDGGTCRFTTPANSQCLAFSCGNGVVEGNEDCDAGSQNGQYGSHCTVNCTTATSRFCGDGSLAGGEQCDAGSQNGQYNANYSESCSFNCTTPGPTCGDRILNGTEECDTQDPEISVGYCTGDQSPCETDAQCASGTCNTCGTDSEGYQLSRKRTCGQTGSTSACKWSGWGSCQRFDQVCGNGVVEGGEECDDGNDNNNDACKNNCEPNVCGDGEVYTGVESCDLGRDNGTGCNAPYGGTCNSCTSACKLVTESGGYCGDGVVNGNEACEPGTNIKRCAGLVNGEYEVGSFCDNDNDCQGPGTDPTCKEVGVCDGGTENGEVCGVGVNQCDGGTCVAPTCAANCSSSCPFDYQAANLTAVVEPGDQSPQTSFDLHDYDPERGPAEPDTATMQFPACNAAVALTADIDMSNVTPPPLDIVFITDTSGSMDEKLDVAVQATKDSIDELVSTYQSLNGTLRVGLMQYEWEACADDDNSQEPVVIDKVLTEVAGDNPSPVSDLKTELNGYCDQGGTPTYNALEAAFTGSAPDKNGDDQSLGWDEDHLKFVVLLSDGDPDGAPEDIKNLVEGNNYETEYGIFTAALTSSGSLEANMRHFSSDECQAGVNNFDACSPREGREYAYSGTTTEDLEVMYESIIDNILGAAFSFSRVVGGQNETVVQPVREGVSVELPFPPGFECTGQVQNVPMRLNFNAGNPDNDTINISNVDLSFCPAGALREIGSSDNSSFTPPSADNIDTENTFINTDDGGQIDPDQITEDEPLFEEDDILINP